MPRFGRTPGESGVYHVMLRGNDQNQLFYDDADRRAFLDRLARFRKAGRYQLYAFALMSNHVHLLVREVEDELATLMKRLTLSYSYWFNVKYDRSGFLFQGRFRSEPVDDDAYLLTVFKYIHHNPLKVGESMSPWTSYDHYLNPTDLVDTDFILAVFANYGSNPRHQVMEFLNEPSNEESSVQQPTKPRRFSDEVAIEMITRIAEVDTCNKVSQLSQSKRNQILYCLKSEGLTIRHIARLTGISRGIVQRATTEVDGSRETSP